MVKALCSTRKEDQQDHKQRRQSGAATRPGVPGRRRARVRAAWRPGATVTKSAIRWFASSQPLRRAVCLGIRLASRTTCRLAGTAVAAKRGDKAVKTLPSSFAMVAKALVVSAATSGRSCPPAFPYPTPLVATVALHFSRPRRQMSAEARAPCTPAPPRRRCPVIDLIARSPISRSKARSDTTRQLWLPDELQQRYAPPAWRKKNEVIKA